MPYGRGIVEPSFPNYFFLPFGTERNSLVVPLTSAFSKFSESAMKIRIVLCHKTLTFTPYLK